MGFSNCPSRAILGIGNHPVTLGNNLVAGGPVPCYCVNIASPELNDTFVICYAEPSGLWAAYSIQTRQVGVGDSPKEALANGMRAVDQAIEASGEYPNTHVCSLSHELMRILAETALPLTDGECSPGVVYIYIRTALVTCFSPSTTPVSGETTTTGRDHAIQQPFEAHSHSPSKKAVSPISASFVMRPH